MKRKAIYRLIKRIPLVVLIFLFMPCHAQYQEKNEVSIFAGGGFSSSSYSLKNVPESKFTPGYGGVAGLGYTFFFNNTIGIGTGAEIAMYNSKVKIDQFSDKYTTSDGDENFEFRYTVNGYTEKQRLFAVQIPLFVQFQFPLLSDDHLTYLTLGGRVGFPPFSAEYRSSSNSYVTSGYYPQYDVLLETPASQGFGTFLNRTYKEDLKFDHPLYMLSAELGMKWLIADHFSLYTGIYFDYSLNDIYQNKEYGSFLNYSASEPTAFSNLSILQSRYYENNNYGSFTGKIRSYALGIKVRLSFRIPDKRSCCF